MRSANKQWKEPIHWPAKPDGKASLLATSTRQAPPKVTGPELWARLHNYRWTSYTDFRDWFDAWLRDVARLPLCGCSKKFKTTILPQFSDRFCRIETDEEWFQVSWEIHQAVNESLDKSGISLADARMIYSRPSVGN